MLPSLRSTLNGWEQPITLQRRIQNVVNGLLVTTYEDITFRGVVQAMSDEKLQFKDIGERSWEWYWVHAKAGTLNLETQDKIIYNGNRYVVLARKDYSPYGFIEYEIVRDYDRNST